MAAVRDREGARGIRWVRTDALHLTLRFLGSTPRDRIPALERALAAIGDRPAFAVELRGAGGFPSPHRPRVLWIGLTRGVEPLTALADDVGRVLEPLGWAEREGRPFRAHLTVARTDAVPFAVGGAAAAALGEAARDVRIAFTADRVTLFRSILGRGPARYEVVAERRFEGPSDRERGAGDADPDPAPLLD